MSLEPNLLSFHLTHERARHDKTEVTGILLYHHGFIEHVLYFTLP